MKQKILIVIAYEGFQPIEYLIPKKTFEHAGYKVITASNKSGTATAADKTQAPVDMTIDQAVANDYAAVIFVGGPGALDNLDNQVSYQLITQTVDLGKILGAICVAPRILAHASVLTDVAATGWDEDNQLADIFNEHGVTYIKAPVVSDQGIVTAAGPAAAQEFADTILAELK